MFDIPVLLVTFNRPETTKRVFERIRAAKPPRLYLFSDSPRKGNKEDEQKVRETRQLITNVDWDCEVFTKFEDNNLGCGPGPSSAISWIFRNEKKAIILEDDCLPHETFFSYCKYMLDKYEHDERVMHIAGTRWNEEYKTGDADHSFSSIGHIWGWASWSRAWEKYDYTMKEWNKKKDQPAIRAKMGKRLQTSFWIDSFENNYKNNPVRNHAWDYQWQYTLFKNNGLSILPNVNLIANIGIVGVHSGIKDADNMVFNRPVSAWVNTGKEPGAVKAAEGYDSYHVLHFFLKDAPLKRKLKLYVKSFI